MRTFRETRSTPQEVIASFDRYEDAQELVDWLSNVGFPVERLTIVGRDLELVERATGRLDAGRSALYGGLSFIPIAILFGWLFGVFFAPDAVSLITTILYWLLVGIVVGAVYGLLSYVLINRGERNFVSLSGIHAQQYDVLVDASSVGEALRRIAERDRQPSRAPQPSATRPTSDTASG